MEDKAKKFADELLQKAQGLLCKDGFLAPVVFSAQGDEIVPVLLQIRTDEDKDGIPEILKTLSHKSDFIVMILDSYVKPIAEDEDFPATKLAGDPDALSALVVFLYLKDGMHIRNMTYIKNKEGRYNFFDQGWEKVLKEDVMRCRFENPFYKS